MDQDRQAELAVPIREPTLLGPHPALDHGVDRLEVAGIRRQRDVDLVPVARVDVGREAEVILDVAVPGGHLGQVLLELAEDHAVRLVHDIGQHAQPAAVRHPHDDLADPVVRGSFDQRIQQRDQGLATLEREPLLADVPLVQERLEELGGVQLQEDATLPLEVEVRPVPRPLHPIHQPLADFGVADVHELDADRPAVGLLEDLDQVAERRIGRIGDPGVERAVEVRLGQAEGGEVEPVLRLPGDVEPEGVEPGEVVAHLAIGVDEPGDGGLRLAGLRVGFGAVAALGGLTQIISLEEELPALVDRSGVVAPPPVVLLDQLQIPAVRHRRTVHG
jgi:hypothetical protein